MKPLGKVKIEWSPEFAYAIGLIVTDGCLYNDERHISFTSKDRGLVETFAICLNLNNKIGRKSCGRAGEFEKKYFVIQFGDVIFYNFLLTIGLHPNKSKTLSEIDIPSRYIFDFLRGHLDGDGTFYSYWDSRWRSSYMFYTVFMSASKNHLAWIRKILSSHLGIHGHVSGDGKIGTCYRLKYAKTESLQLLEKIYYNDGVVCLRRKREKIRKALWAVGIIL